MTLRRWWTRWTLAVCSSLVVLGGPGCSSAEVGAENDSAQPPTSAAASQALERAPAGGRYQCLPELSNMNRWVSVEITELSYGPAIVPAHGPCVIKGKLIWSCRAQAPVSVTGTACFWPQVAVPEPRCLESSVTVLCEKYKIQDGLNETAPLITDSLYVTGLSCDLTSDEVTRLANQEASAVKSLYARALTEWCSAERCSAAFGKVDVDGPEESYAWDDNHPVDHGLGYGNYTCMLCPSPSLDPEFNRLCPNFVQRFGNPPSRPPGVNQGYFDQCVLKWRALSRTPGSACFTTDEELTPTTEGLPPPGR